MSPSRAAVSRRGISILLVLGALAAMLMSLVVSAPMAGAQSSADDEANILVIRTTAGDIVAALLADRAPVTTSQVKALAESGAYDGVQWFRVMPGFLIQTGTVEANRVTPPTEEQLALAVPLELELSPDDAHPRGTLSMARLPDDLNSGTSSFSIVVADSPRLDGEFTPFGFVVAGMEIADYLSGLPRDPADVPLVPVLIEEAMVVTEAELEAMAPTLNTTQPVLLVPPGTDAAGNPIGQPGSGRAQPQNAPLIASLLIAIGFAVAAFMSTGKVSGAIAGGFALLSAVASFAALLLEPEADGSMRGALLFGVVFGAASFVAAVAGRIEPRFSSALALLGGLGIGSAIYLEVIPGSSELSSVLFFVGMFLFLRLLSRFEAIMPPAKPAKSATNA